MAMKRVEVYSFKLILESKLERPLFWESPQRGSVSNLQLYDSEETALAAAHASKHHSPIAIEIIKQWATLPDHQIAQLAKGLRWSSEISSGTINLEFISSTKHAPRE